MPPSAIPHLITAYYQRALPNPPEDVKGTLIEQQGQIRLSPERPWMPFTAEQTFRANTPDFVWHARFKMAPLLTGVVVDSYQDGQGLLDAKIWGMIPVAHAEGPRVDRGEIQRYLAELVWCPMAFLHNPQLNYSQLSEDMVRVWVDTEQNYVDLLFNAEGDISGAKTTTRYRDEQMEPWEGRFSAYTQFGEIRAPAKAEVWWGNAEDPFVYWKGEIIALQWHTD